MDRVSALTAGFDICFSLTTEGAESVGIGLVPVLRCRSVRPYILNEN